MQKAVLAGITILLLAIIGGGIYFLHLTAPVTVSQTVPVAPTLAVASSGVNASTAPMSAATTGSAPLTAVAAPAGAQVYRIDAGQSQVAYHVKETFINRNNQLNEAVGVTKAIAGDVQIDRAHPAASKIGDIVIDISQLKSDSDRRDNAIRRQWLESSRYPQATFTHATVSDLPSGLQEGTPFQFKMGGDMTVHGVTKPVTWNVSAVLQGTTLRGQATTQLKMSDFNVRSPDIAGMLRAEDNVALVLDFVAVAQGAAAQ